MDWSEELQAFTYQCPCGDLFQITVDELAAGEMMTANLCCFMMWGCGSKCGDLF